VFLETAIAAARAGEQVIRHYYRNNAEVRIKADRTPVTIADVETEQAIKQVLRDAFPDHGFYGEETGRERADADYVWLIDPIDGTKSFVRDYPFFSTQIALLKNETFILGVSNAPLFDELAFAEAGGGAYLNDRPLRVSEFDSPEQAILSFGNIRRLTESARWSQVGKLIQRFDRVRGYGDFYHYHLLAAGKIDAVIESDVNILDIAALSVIVQEAGGRVSDLQGAPLSLQTTTIIATNGKLHDEVCKALQEAVDPAP
jgi:histidinol-phosphatase